jgi:hypothetical protein
MGAVGVGGAVVVDADVDAGGAVDVGAGGAVVVDAGADGDASGVDVGGLDAGKGVCVSVSLYTELSGPPAVADGDSARLGSSAVF